MKRQGTNNFVISYAQGDLVNNQGLAIEGTYDSGTITIDEMDEVVFNTQNTTKCFK